VSAPRPAAARRVPAAAARSSGRQTVAAAITAGWGPTAGRVFLGLVLAWFGYHELTQPTLWTGYVPGVSATSTVAIILVLAHGWLLLVLSVALIAGIWVRGTAAVTALLLAQIIIWLTVTAGLSDLTVRDFGVLGLALCLTGATEQRFILAN
jgi:uncharacterized membrane protein YphA (DoxX/SURF4 family)